MATPRKPTQGPIFFYHYFILFIYFLCHEQTGAYQVVKVVVKFNRNPMCNFREVASVCVRTDRRTDDAPFHKLPGNYFPGELKITVSHSCLRMCGWDEFKAKVL